MTKFFGWIFTLRYFAILAIIAPVFGALLMFLLGATDTINAYLIFFGQEEAEGAVGAGEAAMIKLVGSVDHFLFGTILLIFAIGLYFLFFRGGDPNGNEKHDRIPSWKQLSKLEGMDLMLMKVIIMLMTVSFLEFILSSGIGNLTWPILVIPITIIALAAALRWMQSGPEDGDSSEDSRVSVTGPSAVENSVSAEPSYIDELERLASLYGQGVLNDQEFQARKEKILQT